MGASTLTASQSLLALVIGTGTGRGLAMALPMMGNQFSGDLAPKVRPHPAR